MKVNSLLFSYLANLNLLATTYGFNNLIPQKQHLVFVFCYRCQLPIMTFNGKYI